MERLAFSFAIFMLAFAAAFSIEAIGPRFRAPSANAALAPVPHDAPLRARFSPEICLGDLKISFKFIF